MMRRYCPPIFILAVFIVSFNMNHIVEISSRQNLIDWRKRREKMTNYCESDKAVKLKKNFLESERTFQKRLVENIVHVNNLRINWCLGKSAKINIVINGH